MSIDNSMNGLVYGNLFLILVSFMMFFSCTESVNKPGSPKNLRCEYQTNPLGLDTEHPRFFWHIDDSRRNAVQSAYQIIVASNESILAKDEGDIWDSDKVESDQSVHVVYTGPALKSRTKYYWKVRTWDADGQASPFSNAAWWEMGLLSPKDWHGSWIGKEIVKIKSKPKWPWGYWIWHPMEKGIDKPVFFRKLFILPEHKTVEKALIRTTADNYFTVYLNGAEIGNGSKWSKVYEFNIKQNLQSGKNLIAVEAANNLGEVCGFLFSLKIMFDDGSNQVVNSDKTWITIDRVLPDWMNAAISDKNWANVQVLAKYDNSEWGNIDPDDDYDPPRSILVRNEFKVKSDVRQARAYVTGLGNYIMYLNGQRVGNDVFTPGWTDYPTRIQYQVYDVTEHLIKGGNAVGAILGNMWWSGGLGWKGAVSYSEGPLRFLLQLEVEYKDGSTEQIYTNRNWNTSDSPISENHIYNGEVYDARIEKSGWATAGFDDSDWQSVIVLEQEKARLVVQQGPTIQVTEDIRPVDITAPDSGLYVFDMGQNMVGWARLRVRGPAGRKVVLRFAEVLKEDGHIYIESLRGAKATDSYILKGEGTEIWEPHFTYHGFRYVEVKGYPGKPTKDDMTGRVIHSSPPVTLDFSCSNDLINKIHKNITWGQRGNMHSVPTDCPQRDERLGWMGDAQIFAPTASYNMQMARFFSKWMRDISDCQDEDGAVHDVNPAIVVSGPAKPGWGDAVLVVPWIVYQFYGDKRVIEENYEAMAAWVGYMKKHSKGYLYERSGYGDWIAVVESPKKPIGAAYFYYSTKLLANMAGIIGKKDEEKEYNELARSIADAYQKKYFDKKSGQYEGATQTSNLLPLAFGITPAELTSRVIENIVKDVEKRGNHPSTGFLGTAYLLPLLSQNGHHELAYLVANQRTSPSWGYMVDKGATTIWELWDGDTKGPEMNSRNHFALGSIGEWFYAWLAGIRPDPQLPGFKRVIIAPQPAGDLTWAEGKLNSIYGMIRSRWHIKGDGLTMNVTIPANTTALIHIPVIDKPWSTITEGGTLLINNEETIGGMTALRFVNKDEKSVIFEAGSGEYEFTAM